MDLWEFNKLAAAVLLCLLVIFGANTAVPILYPEGGPGDYQVVEVEDETQTAEAEVQEEEAPQVEPLPVLLAAADPGNGETIARQCVACHVFEEDGPNRVGPNLWAVPGREVASVGGFSYSNALQEYGGDWTYEKLDCFLENPSECVPGTSMAYAGIKDAQDRADMIAYLASLGETPPFPEAEETAEAPAETEQAAAPEAAPADESDAAEEQAAAPEETDMASAEEPAGEEAATEEPAETAEAPAGENKLAALLADASAAEGEQAVRVCAACHSFEEGQPHRIGPNLYGIMGADIAAVEGFNNYSDALKGLDGTWTYERMDDWLAAPMDYVPGTTMAYAGVKDDAERANIIAYLASLGDAPPLPGAEQDAGQADTGEDAAQADDGDPETEAASLEGDTTAN
jgi:cytochrome c2